MNASRSIRLYTDEDVHSRLATQLTLRGFDALSCRDAGNAGRSFSDDWQLRFATEQGRVILTHNIRDFLHLAREWETRSFDHSGIILAQRLPLGELLARTEQHLGTYDAFDHQNLVLYLAL